MPYVSVSLAAEYRRLGLGALLQGSTPSPQGAVPDKGQCWGIQGLASIWD